MMTALYAGAAVRRITPDLDAGPAYLAGFQANRPATGVHDHLHVRALALRAGESGDAPPFLLAICDLIGLLHADVLDIRRAAAGRGLDASASSSPAPTSTLGPTRSACGAARACDRASTPTTWPMSRNRWSMPSPLPWRACAPRTYASAGHR